VARTIGRVRVLVDDLVPCPTFSPSTAERGAARRHDVDGRRHAAMTAVAWTVRRVTAVDEATLAGLADVLIDCVEGGASVSFMHPLPRERALAFWRRVADDVRVGARALLVAEDDRGICGTVQLVLAQPENQPHRADLAKMLVHRRARRHGVGAALLRAAEAAALDCGRTVLVLDTASADAERLYERAGWVRVGIIPNYALLPFGGFCDTVLFYRDLSLDARRGWRRS
jgi:GNAT superfamily N-acetyltransferase